MTAEDQQAMRAKEPGMTRRVLRSVFVTPMKLAADEAKASASIIGWNIKSMASMLSFNRKQAQEDIEAAKADPEKFWDDIVVSAKVTETSLRKRYRQASIACYALLIAIAASVGIAANLHLMAMTVGNLVLLNILIMLYVSQLHRLYTAREQRIITIPKFLAILLKTPPMIIPIPLPDNYKLRESKPSNSKAEEVAP